MLICRSCGWQGIEADMGLCPKCSRDSLEVITIKCPICVKDLETHTHCDINSIGWSCDKCKIKIYKEL